MIHEPALHQMQEKLSHEGKPYVVATVIRVRGSASAKTGSKMLISAEGENLFGWIGGGCAESFTKENALEALKEKQTRIITADLDDEVFGLGMPCGGVMEIFLEPYFPQEVLQFPCAIDSRLNNLCEHYGFGANFTSTAPKNLSMAGVISLMAQEIARCRKTGTRTLQESKKLGSRELAALRLPPSELLILGCSRITEELAKLSALLEWNTRVYGIQPVPGNYPSRVKVEAAQPNYEGLNIRKESIVIVASHHRGDAEYISAAIQAHAQYVGFIASAKRAGIVFDHLRSKSMSEAEIRRISAPAGIDLQCQNPSEIALSIMAEILVSAI